MADIVKIRRIDRDIDNALADIQKKHDSSNIRAFTAVILDKDFNIEYYFYGHTTLSQQIGFLELVKNKVMNG